MNRNKTLERNLLNVLSGLQKSYKSQNDGGILIFQNSEPSRYYDILTINDFSSELSRRSQLNYEISSVCVSHQVFELGHANSILDNSVFSMHIDTSMGEKDHILNFGVDLNSWEYFLKIDGKVKSCSLADIVQKANNFF